MSETDLRVVIGFDSKEPIAYHVALSSLHRHESRPVSVTPLRQDTLRRMGLYTRERQPNESTEFSLTRFLVPALMDYQGWALFVDCDVLFQADVFELLTCAEQQRGAAVFVAQHDYVPNHAVKFDGHVQTTYPRKNWSSVMLFNCARCADLTPEYVNTASGVELHRFSWLPDFKIGSLPLEWNWLVGEYPSNPQAKLLHYTLGGPWHGAPYDIGPEADRWRADLDAVLGYAVVRP